MVIYLSMKALERIKCEAVVVAWIAWSPWADLGSRVKRRWGAYRVLPRQSLDVLESRKSSIIRKSVNIIEVMCCCAPGEVEGLDPAPESLIKFLL